MPYSDPDKQRAYQRTWLANRKTLWLQEHGPCVDCGSWDQLEIDHVDPSQKITHNVWSWNETRRTAELAKCVPRCNPCHKSKTLQWYYDTVTHCPAGHEYTLENTETYKSRPNERSCIACRREKDRRLRRLGKKK